MGYALVLELVPDEEPVEPVEEDVLDRELVGELLGPVEELEVTDEPDAVDELDELDAEP